MFALKQSFSTDDRGCQSGYWNQLYPKVSELAAWSENCKRYSSLPLGAVVSVFLSQSSEFCCHNPLCCFSTSVYCCYRCLFRYRLSPETFEYTLVILTYLLTYLLTYSLTHSLLGAGYLKRWLSLSSSKNILSYGTRRFITVFTQARHWILSWASWIQFTPSSPISLRSILMLSSHLRLRILTQK
jgi:hypothetical protein